MKRKINKTTVDALRPGDLIWDTDIKGFGVRCQQSKKVYLIKSRVNGRQRWFKLGVHGQPITAEQARTSAKRILGEIADGRDPHQLREGRRHRVTMAEFAERYMAEYALPKKRPSSAKTDRSNIDNHVVPLLGEKYVSDISQADIEAFLRDVAVGKSAKRGAKKTDGYKGGAVVAGGKGVSNRCRSLLSKMFNLAEKWGERPQHSNPVKHASKFEEQPSERYLTSEEMSRLGEALTREEKSDPDAVYWVAAVRLLMVTGARLDEILTLKWEMVDWERSVAFLPESKTGKKPLHLVPAAIEILRAIPRVQDTPYVIVGRVQGAHLVNVRKRWNRVRREIGLSQVRLHDLRHTFASVAVSNGYSLPVIGKLLGHKSLRTTERYAHLANSVVAEAGQDIANKIAAHIR